MSSIFGVVHLDQSPVATQLAEQAESVLDHRGEALQKGCIFEWAYLSVRQSQARPERAGIFQTEEGVAAFEGRVYFDSREVSEAKISKHNGTVRLQRDAVGIRPLYYSCVRNVVIFSSEIKAILAHPWFSQGIDWLGLSGYCIGEKSCAEVSDTGFSGIYSVPPGHFVEFQLNGKLACGRHFDFDVSADLTGLTFSEACEEFRFLFLRAIRRRIQGGLSHSVVSVSGGLDSSAILCAALHQALDIQALSYVGNYPDADESRFLNLIENQHGIEIARFPLAMEQQTTSKLPEQIMTVEAPIVDYLWGSTKSVFRMAREIGAGQLLSGHWGDQIFFNTGYLVDLLRSGKVRVLREHLAEFDKWSVAGLGRRLAAGLPRELAKSFLPASMLPILARLRKRWRNSNSDQFLHWPKRREGDRPEVFREKKFASWQMRDLYLMLRSKHFSHSMEWGNKVGERENVSMCYPLVDVDLLQFLIKLPGELQNHQGIPRAILRESLKGILPDEIRRRTWKADFSDVIDQSIRFEAEDVLSFLSTGLIAGSGLVNARPEWIQHLESLTGRLSRDNCQAAWQLYDYYALEVFLKSHLSYPVVETFSPQEAVENAHGP